MRYRKLDPNGDYQFLGTSPFLVDSPETVAQAVETRLKLFTDEWFLDSREGLDLSLILGYGTQGTRDLVIKRRILQTPGVLGIIQYSSSVDPERKFVVTATINTIYGTAQVTAAI